MKHILVMIGAPGSGKSYASNLIKELDDKWEIVASDDIREAVGDMNVLHKPFSTFIEVDKKLIGALSEHDYVIYDACNLSKLRRKLLFHDIKSAYKNIDITGLVFKTPLMICISQNKSEERNHHIKSSFIVLSKLITKINRPSLNEGFNRLLRPDDFIKKLRNNK